jgi:prepilin-type N-terminal cleavage/methylation domain-containing protein
MLIRGTRRAFSIAEILVALAIMAILSAVIIPRMNAHISEADAANIAGDLVTIQGAIKAFASDVHRYPGKIKQLSEIIDGNAKDINASSYPSNLVGNWQGPYLVRDLTDYIGIADIDASIKPVTGDNGVKYATIQINNLPFTEFAKIEKILDAGTSDATSSTAGVITYSGTTLKFLAVPLM